MQTWSQWNDIHTIYASLVQLMCMCGVCTLCECTWVEPIRDTDRPCMTSFIGFTHEWGHWQQHKLHHMKEFCTLVLLHDAYAISQWLERLNDIAPNTKENINLFAVNAEISKTTSIYDLSNCFDQSVFISIYTIADSRQQQQQLLLLMTVVALR